MIKLRLKRHGSFSIREGWFEKAINSIKENEKSIFGKENGVAILGIGANMVTSLRFWLIASDIIHEKTSLLSDFGNLLVEYDPYLDTNFSWWMIHQHLISNFKEIPVFNIIFNNFDLKKFTKETIKQFILNYMQENNYDMSNSARVEDDITILLRTYINEKILNPEDNLNSPFGKLGLLKKEANDLYIFTQPSYENLPYQAVYCSLLNCLDEDEIQKGINIDDLINKNNSPSKIFNLDKNLLYLYLNDMKKVNLVTINKTAGLNMVYFQKIMSEKEVFEKFFLEAE